VLRCEVNGQQMAMKVFGSDSSAWAEATMYRVGGAPWTYGLLPPTSVSLPSRHLLL
jgi:hypothetical protein